MENPTLILIFGGNDTNLCYESSRKKKEQNIQVTKMFVVTVMVFSLSTFPNQVLWLWVDFGDGKDSDYFAIISAVC